MCDVYTYTFFSRLILGVLGQKCFSSTHEWKLRRKHLQIRTTTLLPCSLATERKMCAFEYYTLLQCIHKIISRSFTSHFASFTWVSCFFYVCDFFHQKKKCLPNIALLFRCTPHPFDSTNMSILSLRVWCERQAYVSTHRHISYKHH